MRGRTGRARMLTGRAIAIAVALISQGVAAQQATPVQQQAPPTDPLSVEIDRLMEEGISAYNARDYARASNAMEQVVLLVERKGGKRSADYARALDDHATTLVAFGKVSEAERLKRNALAVYAEILGERHPSTIASLSSLGVHLNRLGRSSEAEPLHRKALALRTEILGERHPDTITSLNNLAATFDVLGRLSEAEPPYRKVLLLRTEILGERHPDTMASLGKLASVLQTLGRSLEAEALHRKALALRTEVLGERHPDTMNNFTALAAAFNVLGRSSEAEPLVRKALALQTEILGERHSDTIASLSQLSYTLDRLGRSSEAEPLRRRALALQTEILGERHPDTIASLNNLASTLLALGRSSEAEPLYRKALSLRTEVLGERHRDTIGSLNDLGHALDELGRSAEAEPLKRKAVMLYTEVLGERHPYTITSLNNLAFVLHMLGRSSEAEPLHRKVLALRTEILGERHRDTISGLSNLAFVLDALGRSTEAEPLHRRALALRTEILGERHPDTVASLTNLALNLNELGRFPEVEPLHRKALALHTELLGERHPSTITSLGNLAYTLGALGRLSESVMLNRRALALRTEVLGERHPDTIISLNNLAYIVDELGLSSEAEQLYRKALTLRIEILGERHPDTIVSLSNLASSLNRLNRSREAEPLNRRALALRTEILGEQHPATLVSLNNLAHTLNALGRFSEAEPLDRKTLALRIEVLGERHPLTLVSGRNLALSLLRQPFRAALALDPARAAVAGIKSSRALSGFTAHDEAQRSRDDVSQQKFFKVLADADWAAAAARPSRSGSLRSEAFGAMQDATSGATSRAVVLAAARRLAEDKGAELGAMAAERQSLADQWQSNEEALTKALGESGPEIAAKRDRLRKAALSIETRMAEIDAMLRLNAPAYFAVTRPEAIPFDQAQALLKPDEAVLMILPTEFGTHVMALTRDGLEWTRSELKEKDLAAMVSKLRTGLEPPSPDTAAAENVEPALRPFDRTTAYQLHQALIAPMLPALKDKKRLFVAADGALASLPFGVLVASAPQGDDADPKAVRATDWFHDRFALIQIPSLQSLQFLRTYGVTPGGGQAGFVGFGDPVLGGIDFFLQRGRKRPIRIASIMGKGVTRDGGGLADVIAISQLPNLPGTRIELEQLREALGAPPSSLHLGAAATEPALRSMSLGAVGILAFATHGVMAGEIRGVGEPGLILTPPTRPSSEDDGYLAASEITGLRLNADWVILSACNTAAGDEQGGVGLSGLARAFFYAGARNLLVSHWPVRDDIAPLITTDTIRRQRSSPGLSRAAALQQAVRTVRETVGNEHPSIWAPFTLVGAGE